MFHDIMLHWNTMLETLGCGALLHGGAMLSPFHGFCLVNTLLVINDTLGIVVTSLHLLQQM